MGIVLGSAPDDTCNNMPTVYRSSTSNGYHTAGSGAGGAADTFVHRGSWLGAVGVLEFTASMHGLAHIRISMDLLYFSIIFPLIYVHASRGTGCLSNRARSAFCHPIRA